MKLTKTQIYDKLHRGTVLALMALTAYGFTLIGMRTYRYFTVIRPLQKERLLLTEEESQAEDQMNAQIRKEQIEAQAMRR